MRDKKKFEAVRKLSLQAMKNEILSGKDSVKTEKKKTNRYGAGRYGKRV